MFSSPIVRALCWKGFRVWFIEAVGVFLWNFVVTAVVCCLRRATVGSENRVEVSHDWLMRGRGVIFHSCMGGVYTVICDLI